MRLKEQPLSFQLYSLIALALLCGLLWRFEIEYHGWDGLNWIGYFHWALPIDVCLFMIWINLMIPLPPIKRILFNLTLITFGLINLYFLYISAVYSFTGGPSGFVLFSQTPKWLFYTYLYLPLLLIPSIPLLGYSSLKIFGIPIPQKRLWVTVLLFSLSIFSSAYIIDYLPFVPTANFIHVIKSGWIFPFSMIPLGLLILRKHE